MKNFHIKSFFRTWAPVLILITVVLAGCAAPIGVSRVGTQDAYLGINANALSGDEFSEDTKIVLHRFDMTDQFQKDPPAVIAWIHKKAFSDERRDLYYALSELSFYYGEKLQNRSQEDTVGQPWMNIGGQMKLAGNPEDYYLMSALYAYHYLLGPAREDPPDAYDRRFRVACDLHNGALAKAFATGEKGRLEFREGIRRLPVFQIAITIKKDSLPWSLTDFKAFLPADEFRINGLSVRNRTPGLGLPMIAILNKTPLLPVEPAMPVTAFLRMTGYSRNHATEAATADLEFYSGYEEADVTVNGRKVPLETDSTAPLAYKLNDSSIWGQLGIKRFLSAKVVINPEIVKMQPYQPGRIPVVFVHGTASSPLWWAEMINTLRSDPVLRERCQFWLFIYNSSGPIVISASALRDSLSEDVQKLDPEGKDPGLQDMVVIGHSQGGLLTKMTVVDPGDRLWHSISDVSLDDMNLKPETKQKLKQYFFFKPLPFVKRVVFISTPHRGSFLANKGYVRALVRKLVDLPRDVVNVSAELISEHQSQLKLPPSLRGKIPTSVDGMSSDNPVLMTLVELPIAPGVAANSIIAVKGDEDYHTGNDGVVEYTSAHLEGVESEFIVRSEHSCQGHPLTIEEVRRILREHLALYSGTGEVK
jgi:pimeloyl-ACP methyl ester carboxylesterase